MADLIDHLELSPQQAAAFVADPLGVSADHAAARRRIADAVLEALDARRPIAAGDRVLLHGDIGVHQAARGRVEAVSRDGRFAWVEWADTGYATEQLAELTRAS